PVAGDQHVQAARAGQRLEVAVHRGQSHGLAVGAPLLMDLLGAAEGLLARERREDRAALVGAPPHGPIVPHPSRDSYPSWAVAAAGAGAAAAREGSCPPIRAAGRAGRRARTSSPRMYTAMVSSTMTPPGGRST